MPWPRSPPRRSGCWRPSRHHPPGRPSSLKPERIADDQRLGDRRAVPLVVDVHPARAAGDRLRNPRVHRAGLGHAILVALFGAWALIDGFTSIWTGICARHRRNWWLEILEGLVSVVAGVIVFAVPDFAAEILVLLIGVWAIVTGVFQIWSRHPAA